MYDVYICGELTHAKNPEERKKFYESLASVCKEVGLSVYVPHKHTDPIKHPDISPEDVYKADYDLVANSQFLLAYVGVPSIGVGTELEIAKNSDTKIVLLFHKDDKVSRMGRGNPGIVKKIIYESEDDALKQLREFFK